jgi:transcriptional regulator with XRE-family HTH domain
MPEATGKTIDPTIGRRIREIRVWRGMDQKVLAQLAGFSASYLSQIERGLKPVNSRSVQEAFARALEVAPSELTGAPFLLADDHSREHAAIAPLRLALAGVEASEATDAEAPAWPELERRVAEVNVLCHKSDYTTLNPMLPGLLRDLYASLRADHHRRPALMGLADCYLAAAGVAKLLGVPDLAQVAALRLREVTAQLAGPEWDGLAAWATADAIGALARDRAYEVVTRAADNLAGEMDRPEVGELYGLMHLQAALASTVMGKLDQAGAHVNEAGEIARRPGVGSVNFGHLYFGAGNVMIWRTMLAVESGDGGRVRQIAESVDPDMLPDSVARRAAYYTEIGRGYAMERRADEAVRAYRTARELAPQRVKANPWIRDSVTDMLERARRDAAGRELRGLAHWLGIAA